MSLIKAAREARTVDQALMVAATAMQDRNSDAIDTVIRVVEGWLGDHRGMLAALQEMADATVMLGEEGM